ncbi:2,3-bisphosphoglycerate-dependent phosphoglycerate mutase [Methanosphaerula subterraneus]|uniref:2,3-bisphosphoglycerate-dependent phosphoglycerate mutase n=1 Tax=Methanosphaerula subterraneus TaxID=3350244 RepID=UPI003F86646F
MREYHREKRRHAVGEALVSSGYLFTVGDRIFRRTKAPDQVVLAVLFGAGLKKEDLPATESLEDTLARVVPYWNETIVPTVQDGKRVLIAAHGNSFRALVKYQDQVPDDVITGLNIPTGFPLVYELDDSMHPIRHYYLGDEEEIRRATASVANQTAVRK